jgi:hypothetical protein
MNFILKKSHKMEETMLKKLYSVFLLLVLVVGSVSPVFAQGETTGTIEGTITDATGAVVAGASVKVEGNAFNRSATTDDKGYYRLTQVPPGIYKVTVSAPSFSQVQNESLAVALGKASVFDASLKAGGASESVTVTGNDVARIDPTDNKIQTNITERVIESLPKGTNFTSLLKVSPATRAEPLSGQFQIDGASGSENSFIIDGQEVSNFRTGVLNTNNNIPFSFVQEIQIKTSGFEAEFGGATGGVINVVTKGGGNDLHGEFGIQVEDDKFFSRPRPFLSTFRTGSGATFFQDNRYLQPDKDDFRNYFPTAALSGPIFKDRLWFSTVYAPQYFDTNRLSRYYSSDPRTRTLTAQQNYSLKTRQEYFLGRLDGAVTDNLRVYAAYTWNPIVQRGNIPVGNIAIGGAPPSAALDGTTYTGRDLTQLQGGRQNSNNVATQATWTPTSKFVSTFRFSRGFLNERLGAYAIPTVSRVICTAGFTIPAGAGCASGFQNVTSNNQINFDVSKRLNFEGDASYLLSGFGGRHEFKGGYQKTKLTNEVSTGYIPFGIISLFYGEPISSFVDLNPTPGNLGTGQIQRFGRTGKATNNAQSVYFQDKWQPTSRLSLNLGVRLEKEDLPSFNGFAPPINFGWGDKVVPRLGAAYDVTGDGKTKVFGSYGQYTDRLKFELPRGSFGGEFFRVDTFELQPGHPEYTYYTIDRILGGNVDVFGGKCPIVGGTGLSRCQQDFRIASNNPESTIFDGKVDPNLKPFRQTEFTVGIERQLSTNYLFSGRYTHKNIDHAVEDAGFPTPEGSEAYIIGNPGEGLYADVAAQFGYTKLTTPQRRYDAMELRLDRRFANNFYYNAAYTYSRLYGNYSGLASSDEAGRTSPGVNRFFDLPFVGFTADGQPDNGRLATDRPHVFNLYGGYTVNWSGKNATEFSAFTTAQSGTPQTSLFSFYSVTTILQGRGDLGRTPSFTQTDFAISHRYRVTEGSYFQFDLNVINLFNEDNILGLSTQVLGTGTTNAGNLGLGNIDEPAAINRLLNQGILSQVNAFLNDPANPQRRTTAYGLANAFQGGRQVRMGVKYTF